MISRPPEEDLQDRSNLAVHGSNVHPCLLAISTWKKHLSMKTNTPDYRLPFAGQTAILYPTQISIRKDHVTPATEFIEPTLKG